MYKVLIKYKYWVILFLIFLILRIPSLFEPYWYGDEGIYLVLGQAIRKGVTLYSNIHDNKPPTLYYLAAISQTVFGFRFLLLLLMIPTIYVFNRLSQVFLSTKKSRIATFIFLILTSIPLFEGSIANAEVFMLLPTIAGVLLIIKSKPNFKNIILSGLLLGLAFTIKIPVAIEFAFLCLWLLISDLTSFKRFLNSIKNILIFTSAFLLPIALYSLYFYLKGAFSQFLFASLLQNFGYLSSWSTGTHTSSVSSSGIVVRFLFLLIAWVIISLLKAKKTISSKFSFLLFWFSATIFGVLISSRPYPHYLIQALPPLILIIIELFNFKNKKVQFLSLFSFLFFVFLVFKFKFYFYPVFRYYSNFYSYSIGKKSINDYRNNFGFQVNNVYKISEFIEKNTNPKDKIFIWGDEPYIYALSNRLPSSKYTVAYHVIDFNGYQITMDKIKASLPKFIIYYQMSNRPFPDLDIFIKNYYYVTQSVGNATIFKLR
jgi:4-amino-4-deoxy-L-arabinose transferase-like glycosyltransferase